MEQVGTKNKGTHLFNSLDYSQCEETKLEGKANSVCEG